MADFRTELAKAGYPPEWLKELVTTHDQFTCYVVEVCIDCAWNHLVKAYVAGRLYNNSNGNGSALTERRERS